MKKFFDLFRSKKYKTEIEQLSQKINELQAMLTPEMKEILTIQQKIQELKTQQSAEQALIEDLQNKIDLKQNELNEIEADISEKKKNLIQLDDEILVQEFGLYTPKFNFASALIYKDMLQEIRDMQKKMIKNKTAVIGSSNWTVDGNRAKGSKMVSDTQKLLLRAFNSECDDIISNVKYTNFDASYNRIIKSAEAISKLGDIMSIAITDRYLESKINELKLAFEYQTKKQEEKEAAQEAKSEMREAAKLQKEIEEQRKKIKKEQTHYQSAYDKICAQLQDNPDNPDFISKKSELENHLSEIDKSLKDIDYREANQKAGYVYIISNIGAFGKDVYKIGMTRRLDPQERVDELGDASVPFKFDIHAMIFSDNAPALEAALHKAFENKKLNMVNQRREFFNVTLDEIKQVIRQNFDKTVEFTDVPDAEQYRISKKMRGE